MSPVAVVDRDQRMRLAAFQFLADAAVRHESRGRGVMIDVVDVMWLKASFPTPRDAVAYIMDTFPIVRRKDEAKYDGDYRTRRVILETYDALAESIRTGQPYQTRLDPPPADPRCCHPQRGGTKA